MNYAETWKVLEEMVADFRKRSTAVPQGIMNDLKAAKTLIKVWQANPTEGATIQKIEGYLMNVESYLVSEGQKRFGAEYVDKWLRWIKEAGQRDKIEEKDRFVPGLPRDERWIRVKASNELPVTELTKLADESCLSSQMHSDGYVLVRGKDEAIKRFIKQIAARTQTKTWETLKK